MNMLRALREERGVSLREVGRATGVHYEYINLFERKKKFPSKRQLKALERYYKTDLKEYFRGVKIAMLLERSKLLKEKAAETALCKPEDLWR